MTIPENLTGKALIDWVVENKALLLTEKRMKMKEADSEPAFFVDASGHIQKAIDSVPSDASKITAELVINTTNWLDSHKDVHLDGIWNKAVKDGGPVFLAQEHKMDFAHIITDIVTPSVKKLTWKEVGYNAPGITEALMFKVEIPKNRNPFMFDQYRNKFVKNHSVGMIYDRLELAVNSDEYKEEFAVWQKYAPLVVNQEELEKTMYFWAVKSAKIVEGSAVVRGSNRITPVYSMEDSTGKASPDSTLEQPPTFNILEAIQKTKFIY